MHASCPSCNVKLAISENLLGRPIRCSACKNVFTPPLPPTVPVVTEAIAVTPMAPPVPMLELAAPPPPAMLELATPTQADGSPFAFDQPADPGLELATPIAPYTMSRIRNCASQFTFTGYAFAVIGLILLIIAMVILGSSGNFLSAVILLLIGLLSLGVGVFMIVAGSFFNRRRKWGLILTAAILSILPATLLSILAFLFVLFGTRHVARLFVVLVFGLFYSGVRTLFVLADAQVKYAFIVQENMPATRGPWSGM